MYDSEDDDWFVDAGVNSRMRFWANDFTDTTIKQGQNSNIQNNLKFLHIELFDIQYRIEIQV